MNQPLTSASAPGGAAAKPSVRARLTAIALFPVQGIVIAVLWVTWAVVYPTVVWVGQLRAHRTRRRNAGTPDRFFDLT